MRLAFAIFKYFPFGGLQGDMLNFARCAAEKGAEVVIFCDKWEGAEPEEELISVRRLPVRGWSNHARSRSFEKLFHKAVNAEFFDCTFAFNRIGGCDFYFAADNCLAKLASAKHNALALKLLPRYRIFLEQERAIFTPEAKTRIFTIARQQQPDYIQYYNTPQERFISLPPGIRKDCRRPDAATAAIIRKELRQQLDIPGNAVVLLTIGANLDLKGGDRAVELITKLPDNFILLLIGNASEQLRAKVKSAGDKVRFPGPRKDIPELLLACDLMIHPARIEAAGTVLLEAVAAGVPAVATSCCGFAEQLAEAGMPVVQEPFTQEKLLASTRDALANLPELQKKSLEYADSRDIFGRYEKGIGIILRGTLQ